MAGTFNTILSAICGFFFAVSWWLFIDGAALADRKEAGEGAGPFWVYVPGILSTIGLFLMSNLPPSMFQKDNSDEHTGLQKGILVLSVICLFAGVIEGAWCYASPPKSLHTEGGYRQWRGISAIIQAVVIAIISFAWNFLYRDPNAF
jgi:hypothetical protein